MRTSQLAADSRERPNLFQWNGRMDAPSLEAWLRERGWAGQLPADLVELWRETGGGDVFETETVLGPLGDPELGDDIIAVNRELHDRGMPTRYLVFHLGLTTSAVDTESREYVTLAEPAFRVTGRFTSLDDWYNRTLRAEYAQRYGLV